MNQLPSGPDRLILQGHFTGFTPQELFDHFVTPSLLVQWWPTEATVNPGRGGNYEMRWPDMGWVLKGTYKEFDSGDRLVFSWSWNHEPNMPEREVTLDFEPSTEGGAVLTVTHGFYGDSDVEQKDRQGHLEGWMHFLMLLAGLRKGLV